MVKVAQPGFIERIIEQVGLKDARMHDTPADVVLNRDKDHMLTWLKEKHRNKQNHDFSIGKLVFVKLRYMRNLIGGQF